MFPQRCRNVVLAAAALLCAATAWAEAVNDPAAAGKALYREGVGSDGSPVTAVVQGDVEASGTNLACVNCHKYSGLGASEGGLRAVPVTGPALFEPELPNQVNLTRPRTVYSDETATRAIVDGIGADGRVLDPLMPRYRLSGEDAAALVAYLRGLGAGPSPGVGETEVELATIVSADAPPAEREAVIAVLQRFAAIKNSGTRQEQRRAAASRRHPFGEKHVRAFRSWNLSVWTLEGPASTWAAQLDALYAARPPFAVISGTAGADWAVVHGFCERRELPCILPVTDLPSDTQPGHFTIYYSAGVRLDASVTARSIAQGHEPGTRTLVAYTDDARGRAAFEAFREAATDDVRAGLVAHPVAAAIQPTPGDWRKLLASERPGVLVAWLPPPQLAVLAAAASAADALPRRVYTAASFTDWKELHAPETFEQRVLHVYPYSLPAEPGLSGAPREEAWLISQGLGSLARAPAAQALFACHAVGEAMAGMADNYSREYLIESLEHMLDGTGMTTLYPVTTLGTSQRFLVRGAYVVRLAQDATARYVPAGWVRS